jgi:hypothetical protein
MAFSIVSMFQLETESFVLLSIVNPLALNHPHWACCTFPSYHKEDRTTRNVKTGIGKVPLLTNIAFITDTTQYSI